MLCAIAVRLPCPHLSNRSSKLLSMWQNVRCGREPWQALTGLPSSSADCRRPCVCPSALTPGPEFSSNAAAGTFWPACTSAIAILVQQLTSLAIVSLSCGPLPAPARGSCAAKQQFRCPTRARSPVLECTIPERAHKHLSGPQEGCPPGHRTRSAAHMLPVGFAATMLKLPRTAGPQRQLPSYQTAVPLDPAASESPREVLGGLPLPQARSASSRLANTQSDRAVEPQDGHAQDVLRLLNAGWWVLAVCRHRCICWPLPCCRPLTHLSRPLPVPPAPQVWPAEQVQGGAAVQPAGRRGGGGDAPSRTAWPAAAAAAARGIGGPRI